VAIVGLILEILFVARYCNRQINPKAVTLPKGNRPIKGLITMQISFHEISGLSFEQKHKGIVSSLVTEEERLFTDSNYGGGRQNT
jgi:hypothetical protein